MTPATTCFIHQKCFRIGKAHAEPSESPYQPFRYKAVRGQEHLGHSVPTAARQPVNLTFFMGNFDMCSPSGFRRAEVLHFNFGLGRKYYISPLVMISLKKALFCPSSFKRAEQMSSLCSFSSLLRMKGPILAGSFHLCKFPLRIIHKITCRQSWTRELQEHIFQPSIFYGGKLRLREDPRSLPSYLQ